MVPALANNYALMRHAVCPPLLAWCLLAGLSPPPPELRLIVTAIDPSATLLPGCFALQPRVSGGPLAPAPRSLQERTGRQDEA